MKNDSVKIVRGSVKAIRRPRNMRLTGAYFGLLALFWEVSDVLGPYTGCIHDHPPLCMNL